MRTNDIVLLHDNLPNPSMLSRWSNEMDLVLKGIPEKGLEVIPLSDLIGRPVMITTRGEHEIHRDPSNEHPSIAGPGVEPYHSTKQNGR